MVVKHCALAIFKSDKSLQGTPKARFQSALNIALARLTEYGFLTEGSDKRPPDQAGLTAKGRTRDRLHAREGPAKGKEFDQLYKLIERDQVRRDERGDAARDPSSPVPSRNR